MANLKPWVKIALLAILVFGIVFGASTLFGGKKDGKTDKSKKSLTSLISGDGDVINVAVNTYLGFMPIVWLNGGLEPNENSVLYKDYGLKLRITIQDDFDGGRAGFKNDNIDLIYCTTDVLSTEMGSGSDMSDAREFTILNKSRGSDVIVVNKNIKTVADLKGKTVAFAESTVSQTLLINILETNGIGPKDVNYVIVGSGIDAANSFKSGQVDACVTWAPIDVECIKAIPGSKRLISTKEASELSTDGLLAKKEYIEQNKEKLTKLVSAIFYANTLVSTDEKVLNEAAKVFSESFEGFSIKDCIDGSKNIRYVTLGDAVNYFGLNSTFSGVTGEQVYTKMARIYEGLGLTKAPAPWRKVSDTSIIESLMNSNDVKGEQSAETVKSFTAPTKELETKANISDKKLNVEFETGSNVLDNNARALIDREFVNIAKQFRDIRIRVEGNTDWTGDETYNKKLSYRRAESVVNYLVNECGLDKNRFIIVGNGSKHAISNGEKGENQKYRTTDFQLVSE